MRLSGSFIQASKYVLPESRPFVSGQNPVLDVADTSRLQEDLGARLMSTQGRGQIHCWTESATGADVRLLDQL